MKVQCLLWFLRVSLGLRVHGHLPCRPSLAIPPCHSLTHSATPRAGRDGLWSGSSLAYASTTLCRILGFAMTNLYLSMRVSSYSTIPCCTDTTYQCTAELHVQDGMGTYTTTQLGLDTGTRNPCSLAIAHTTPPEDWRCRHPPSTHPAHPSIHPSIVLIYAAHYLLPY
ncbi:hypothetical protein F5B17DRAFT_171247 [Nemania serpens]|nr:hypothetical protein F5B17DRAFT_171247 [Nemania serpens]